MDSEFKNKLLEQIANNVKVARDEDQFVEFHSISQQIDGFKFLRDEINKPRGSFKTSLKGTK